MVYIVEYYSVIKKTGNSTICNNMEGSWWSYVEWNKSETERQISYDMTYMRNLKYDTDEFIYKMETDSHRK